MASMAILACVGALAITAGAAGAAEVIYNNIPKPFPPNLPSIGYEATSTSEFGGQVEFAGAARTNPKITVVMSSWACQSGSWSTHDCTTTPGATFEVPITINVYEVGPANSVGAKIAAGSKTFKIPYRPSASPACTGAQTGEWNQAKGKKVNCFNGKDAKISLTLKAAHLPSKAIIGVAYNTSDYGSEPQRPKACDSEAAGCPYDALNVALNASYNEKEEANPISPSVGAYSDPSEIYVNSKFSAMYCGNEAATGSFGPSGPCWTNEQPAIEVAAK